MLDSFRLEWYNAEGADLGTVDLTAAAVAVLEGGYDDEYVCYHHD